jgi:hypothetical protein
VPGVVGAGGSAAENVGTFPRVAIVCRSLITVVMPDLDRVIAEQQDRGSEGNHGLGGKCAVLNVSGEGATYVCGPIGELGFWAWAWSGVPGGVLAAGADR